MHLMADTRISRQNQETHRDEQPSCYMLLYKHEGTLYSLKAQILFEQL